jgi:Protein of unknown function (DUF3237).
LEIEVRITLQTDDKQHIYMHWKGLRHGPKEVMDRLNRGEDVDPATYYFRTTPYFETSSEKYSWMNRICSIATGSRKASERTLEVFQVLQEIPQVSGVTGQVVRRPLRVLVV